MSAAGEMSVLSSDLTPNGPSFAENDAATDYILVGTSEARPTYQDVDTMLSDKGISLKYARDIGLAPKL